jgi:hypothetical protein
MVLQMLSLVSLWCTRQDGIQQQIMSHAPYPRPDTHPEWVESDCWLRQEQPAESVEVA